MGKKLYFGNLPFSATDQILTSTFAQCGTVESARIIADRDTGRSKGFEFVEMSIEAKAVDAISKFNGAAYDGRTMTVNKAKPMTSRENRNNSFGDKNSGRGDFDLGRRGNHY